jgi:hypothetical protein
MRTINVIKSLEKQGWKVEIKQREIYDHFEKKYVLNSKEYFCNNGRNKCHFYDQEGIAVCVQIQKSNEKNDSQSDYFPGFFAKTIKSIVDGMNY